MARDDLDHIIPRPGELHICITMFRTIGSYAKHSGIYMCWVKSELYGPLTVRQILDGNHVKRGEKAHITTLQALFTLYQEAFLKQHQELHATLQSLPQELCDACEDSTRTQVKKAHVDMVIARGNLHIIEKMSTFEAANTGNTMFKVTRHYMHAYGDGYADGYQSCPNGRLFTTPDNSRDFNQALLHPWQNKLCSYGSCVHRWDVILESIRYRHLWIVHPRKLSGEQECWSTILRNRSRQLHSNMRTALWRSLGDLLASL